MSKHGRVTPRGPVDASMSLLLEASRHPLDPGYRLVAQERAAGVRPVRGPWSAPLVVVLAVVLGAAAAAAALALREPATAATEARRVLESQIGARTEEAEQARREVDALGAQIAALQSELLGTAEAASRGEVDARAVEAAIAPARGPGLRIVLTDAPADDPEADDFESRVQDVDLQVLVNGLFAAGAEAVAINGERLGSTTAIRSAGSAVLVDLTPLSGPYTVEAIGDADAVEAALWRSLAGQHLATLRTTFGIGVQVSAAREVRLPGTGPVTLRYATVPAEPVASADATRAPTDPDVAGSADRSEGREGGEP